VSAEEDAADVRRVLGGEIQAFEGIVRRWEGPLVNLAYRLCRDPGLAEEMAQDAFVRAYRALASWRGDSRFSTWLFALAVNLYRSRLRRWRPAQVSLDAAGPLADVHGAEEALEEEERSRLVRRAVSALPEKYRDAVVMYYFAGMDVEQAARSLGLPEGSLKARLHRGRALLRRKLTRMLSPVPCAARE
jgi:RNA polymerase sigma-70 factor (ECF subfamily)